MAPTPKALAISRIAACGAHAMIDVDMPATLLTSSNGFAVVTVQITALQSVQTCSAQPSPVLGYVDRRPLCVAQTGHHTQMPGHTVQPDLRRLHQSSAYATTHAT